MKKLSIIIMLLFLGAKAIGSETETCVEQIKQWYELLETKIEKVSKKQPFEMKFTMDLVYLNREKWDSISYNSHLISDQSKKYFFGNDMKVFQDQKITASVSLKSKEIHLFNTPPEQYNEIVTKQYAMFEDTLFTAVDNAQRVGKNKVKLFFKEDNPIANGVREMSFDFSGNQLVNTIETIYYPNQPYSRIRVNYHSIDFNSETTVLDKKLMANIMRGNKLIPEYKNYTLYDHRKNK